LNARPYEIIEGLLYSEDHFWIKEEENGVCVVGLTDYGQHCVGDILYLEIDGEAGDVAAGRSFGSLEAGKWVGGLISPLNGVLREVNAALSDRPGIINEDPYGAGWIIKAERTGDFPAGLMDGAAYGDFVEEEIESEGAE
jgi:glycine cleavage system H protein